LRSIAHSPFVVAEAFATRSHADEFRATASDSPRSSSMNPSRVVEVQDLWVGAHPVN
jgi:hypothetical protein